MNGANGTIDSIANYLIVIRLAFISEKKFETLDASLECNESVYPLKMLGARASSAWQRDKRSWCKCVYIVSWRRRGKLHSFQCKCIWERMYQSGEFLSRRHCRHLIVFARTRFSSGNWIVLTHHHKVQISRIWMRAFAICAYIPLQNISIERNAFIRRCTTATTSDCSLSLSLHSTISNRFILHRFISPHVCAHSCVTLWEFRALALKYSTLFRYIRGD